MFTFEPFFRIRNVKNINILNTDETTKVTFIHKFACLLCVKFERTDKKFGTAPAGVCRFTVWDVYSL
jgi:hypothetical protein